MDAFNNVIKFFTLNLAEYTTTELLLVSFIVVIVIIIVIFISTDRGMKTFVSLPAENFTTTYDNQYGTPLKSLTDLQTLSSERATVLLVYDINCGHCKQFQSTWQRLINDPDLTQKVYFRSVGGDNSSLRNSIETSAGVTGYPTLLVVTNNSTFNQYNGSRQFSTIKQYIQTFETYYS